MTTSTHFKKPSLCEPVVIAILRCNYCTLSYLVTRFTQCTSFFFYYNVRTPIRNIQLYTGIKLKISLGKAIVIKN